MMPPEKLTAAVPSMAVTPTFSNRVATSEARATNAHPSAVSV